MRSIGTHRVETMNPSLPFPLSSSPGKSKVTQAGEDGQLDDAIQREDTAWKDDVFDTQLVDFDDETQPMDAFIDTQEMDFGDETQPMDVAVDTQVVDLAGDTQVVDLAGETQVVYLAGDTQVVDLAGESQVMDDELMQQMDTQLLYVSDSESESRNDRESDGGTEVLDDTVGFDDIQSPDRMGDQTTADEERVSSRRPQNNEGAMLESLPSDDTTRKSGRKINSDNAKDGSCSTVFTNGCSKKHSINGNGGKYIKETVALQKDMPKSDQNGLGNEEKADITRSLARKLFTEEDCAEEGSDDNLEVQKADFSQFPGCDNDLAGLSYVDSQEPGELSQANALDFVDRFLKVNLLESNEDATNRTAVRKTVIADSVTKGAKSIAQEATRRSTLAGSSIFEWDENVEDEGGGEFFIKKKDLLIGNCHGPRKSGCKPRSSRHLVTKGSQCVGRIKHKEQRNLHSNIKSLLHSDTKLVIGKKSGKIKKVTGKEVEDCADHQLASDTCDRLALAAPSKGESTELMNVGVDTQMAAEAMEALATGIALMENGSGMTDLDPVNGTDTREVKKSTCRKRSSAQNEACLSKSGVSTRSKRAKVITIKPGEVSKCLLSLRSRSQHATEKLKADLVKPKRKRSMLNVDKSFADHKMKSLEERARNVDSKAEESSRGGKQDNNQSLSVTRRISRKKASINVIDQKAPQLTALNQQNCPGDVSNDFRERSHCFDLVISRKRRTRRNMASKYLNSMAKNSNVTTVRDNAMVDSSSDRGRDLQHISGKGNSNNHKAGSLTAFGGHEVAFGSIARRTRSKLNTQSPVPCKKGIQANAMLLSDKQDACSSPVKGTLTTAVIDGTPTEMRKPTCPADNTPVNLRTPRSAVSPVCMGDDKPSCRRNLSLKNELCRLSDSEEKCSSPFRILRQRRDMSSVKVLFSQHLDKDIVRQQQKILSRLGVPEASSVMEATHFVADMFVRTRNMLEAIADAKFVVTPLWLETCGQANSFIDEKKYILRDIKKEKELGFSMPMSLACSSSHPLLEGRRVLITQNVKPSKEILLSLVKAVLGQAVGRLGRSTLDNDKLLKDLLVLSCEEDFEVCMPLLEKGMNVYSSELLLSGIVTQKLEYERYRLFVDHVKKTRSTLWLKKDGNQLLRVPQTT